MPKRAHGARALESEAERLHEELKHEHAQFGAHDGR